MKQLLGLRNTPARLAILSILKEKNRPLDVLEIFELVKNKADLATVYRTLEVFYDSGLASKVEFREGKYRYELKKNHHHHLICTGCGRVEEVEGDFLKKMEDNIFRSKKFKVQSHSLEFFGLCANCQK